jgi:tRNA1Val (adenine37-N6)-methyltransferase
MTTEHKTEEDFTRDALYEGRLMIMQPRKGYRFSIGAYLLTWFACQGRFADRSADFGAGCGVVGLGLLAAGLTRDVTAVEVQPELAALAIKNAELNDLQSSYRVISSDVRGVTAELEHGAFDLIVTNPPFWPVAHGRLPSDEERQVACHEIKGGIDEWLGSAAGLLNQRRGRLCIVFPARRLDDLLVGLHRERLSATRLCFVHAMAAKQAELVLVEGRFGNTGRLVVDPPITLKEEGGADTSKVADIVSGKFSQKLVDRPDRR